MQKERYKKLSLSIALFSGLALPVQGADFMSDSDVFANAHEISDPELATLRGRFVNGGRIAYFGIEMQSQWQVQNGQMLTTQLNLDVALVNDKSAIRVSKFSPQLTFRASLDDSNSQIQDAFEAANKPAPSGSAGGLENVSGFVQGIQLAGDSNNVNNDLQVSVSGDRQSGSRTTFGSGVVLNPNSTTVLTSSDGITAAAIVEKNTIGLSLAVPGQGTSIQKISGGGINNLTQLVNIGGSHNSIKNLTRLNIQTTKVDRAQSLTFGRTLQQLRGLR